MTTETKQYKCPDCSYTTDNRWAIGGHQRKHRNDGKRVPVDYSPEFVDLSEVPSSRETIWKARFKALPFGKAGKLRLNNRQRAHQVANSIRASAKYSNIAIHTKVIHAEKPVFDEEGWFVYFWKGEESDDH